jgi:hydroxymethylpyrimidine pyrophosphatase-like HAD family hydrolase
MDDTLLTDDHIISEENKKCFFKAQEKEFMLFWHREITPAMIAYAKE